MDGVSPTWHGLLPGVSPESRRQTASPDKITDLAWKWDADPQKAAEAQTEFGHNAVRDWKVESMQNCSACHR
jgi:mono/diheme cytochrome c family protein